MLLQGHFGCVKEYKMGKCNIQRCLFHHKMANNDLYY